ncbi:Mcm2-7 hexameric complex component [Rhizophlyctis rosea]|uniref:DNA replication licensing factor MCM7 n=1 Tax=Rhizophlyctis rosea TaxID=64517 RepID=A0AAD5X4N1_9FUNG|nr:Mcm2-7 hexameric complex component [Rhizophlyctis rosea]
MAVPVAHIAVNYREDKEIFKRFFEKFQVEAKDDLALVNGARAASPQITKKYMEQLEAIAERKQSTIVIDLDDVEQAEGEAFADRISRNTKRYQTLFYEVVDELLPANNAQPESDSDPLEVIMYQRRERDEGRELPLHQRFPPMLTRRYSLFFKPRSTLKALSVRDVKGELVGGLATVRGIVTRVSNVKPQAMVLGLSCDKCGAEIFQEVASQATTPLSECPSEECKKNKSKGKLYMQTRASKLIPFQEIKLQELTDQVPIGHIPRYMTVHLVGDLTRTVSPGDSVFISGIFLPIPYTGFKALRAGLITDTYLEAHHVVQLKKQYSQMELTPEVFQQIEELRYDTNLYSKLARSIAPEIYGHEDVKKALLLLLVGASTKETKDKMKIRGDINICLMGDPGVAKSQLLKQICKIAPRGVYTTGRGSSGVGLTASVTKDPVTEEMVLEGGALVLADNGIACIDEFDKMDEDDRTAIHEVMEQQTISISKAGITTTLNARTSILAAANPQYGRYNINRRVAENINLPAALLSRFDLLFLILDSPGADEDERLAHHVTHVHMHGKHPKNEDEPEPLDSSVIRHYIAEARKFSPIIPKEVGDYIVNAYVHLRGNSEELDDFQYTCARTLLSVIRLATALARLRFSEQVGIPDVEEALRLMDVSKASLLNRRGGKGKDPSTVIYEMIRERFRDGEGRLHEEISYQAVRDHVIGRGYTEQDLEGCLDLYEYVLMRTGNKLKWIQIEENEQ